MKKRLLDRQEVLGWWAVGCLLSVLLSSQAWGLDLDHAIRAQERDSSQVLATLGRDKGVDQGISQETAKTVKVQFIKKASRSHSRRSVVR